MTTLDSSDSTMDEQSNLQQAPPTDQEQNSEESQALWSSFSDGFREVQSVLGRNRVLIQQVNENHRSKNHESMVSNVALIQEINSNVSKIVSLYSDLSTNFSSVFHQRKSEIDADNTSKMFAVCGPHLQTSVEDEVDQASAVCKKKTVCLIMSSDC